MIYGNLDYKTHLLFEMGIDVVTYRIRIGRFGSGRGYTPRDNFESYSRFTKGSDIHLRVIATLVLFTIILHCCDAVQATVMAESTCRSTLVGADTCHLLDPTPNIYLCKSKLCTISINSIYRPNNYYSISERVLFLSGDVELNPGPSDMDTVLKAIQDSESKVLGEIRSVRSEIRMIRKDLKSVKTKQLEDRQAINQLQKNQANSTKDISNAVHNIRDLCDLTHQMQLNIDYLNEVIESKSETIEKLEDDIDRLEKYTKADSMRVFGLPEQPGENDETLRQHVVDNVLTVACPHIDWEKDDIKRTYRIGDKKDDQPPITIVRFRYDDDKPKIFAGRAKLRDQGIRVSNDLTVRQRKELKRLQSKGQMGYFYQGQLIIKRPKSAQDNNKDRVFVSAARQLPQQANSESVRDTLFMTTKWSWITQ